MHFALLPARQRGSAMLIAAGVIVIILLLGLAFLNTSSSNRIAASAGSRSNQTKDAVDATVGYVGSAIAQDWIDYLNDVPGSEYEDYPGLQDPWLAGMEPYHLGGVGTPDTWRQISRIGATYVNPNTLAATNGNNQSLAISALDADADGDGMRDSKWERLPIASSDGTVWLGAFRVIDNSGLVNVNTATSDMTPDMRGSTPADVSLYWLLDSADTAPWGGSFAPDAVVFTQWPGFFDAQAIPIVPMNFNERLAVWQNAGAQTGRRLGVAPGSSATYGFGWSDEAELRLYASRNARSTSALEFALEGNPGSAVDQGALRSYFNTAMPMPTLSVTQIMADRRRLLTVYNGVRRLETAIAGEYRLPMPRWVTELDGSFTHRLNPNPGPTDPEADALRLGQLLELLLSQPPIYHNDAMRATFAAYSLAANVLAYTNGSTDPADARLTPSANMSFYGIEPQPFFAEVVTVTIRKDRPNAPGEDDNETVDDGVPEEEPIQGILIELRNPWPVDVNLNEFTIRVDGVTEDLPPYLLATGEYVVLVGNGNEGTIANLAPTNQLVLNIISDYTDGDVDLLHTASGVLVDRIRSTDPQWPALPAPGGEDVEGDGNWAITSASLQRDAHPNPKNGLPNYVYESVEVNQVIVPAAAPLKNVPENYAGVEHKLGLDDKHTGLTTMIGGVHPTLQLFNREEPMDSIGELAVLFTVCTVDDNGTWSTFGENLYTDVKQAMTVTNKYDSMGKLRLTEFQRSTAPFVPVAMTIFDALDMVSDTVPPAMFPRDPMLYGVINVNTAPAAVLETLPYMYRTDGVITPGGLDYRGVEGILLYREIVGGLRSIGELLHVAGFPDAERGLDYLGRTGTSVTDSAIGVDFTDDSVIDDQEEVTLLFQRMSNLISVRSDVFTAYVLLQGRRETAPGSGNWQPVVQKRFVVTFDRSNVNNTGAAGTTFPRVLMYAEAE